MEVMSADEYEGNRIDMCKEGRLMRKAIEACKVRMDEYLLRRKNIAAGARPIDSDSMLN